MIISPNRRFVFVHVHKCAGTSIETSLADVLGVNDLVIGSTADGEKHKTFFFELLKLRKHSSAAEGREVLGEARWKTYFTFAFVRHPVDRLRSLYAYARGLAARNPLDAEEAAAFRASGALPARVPYKFKAVQAAFTAKDFDAFVRNPRVWQDAGAKPQWQAVCCWCCDCLGACVRWACPCCCQRCCGKALCLRWASLNCWLPTSGKAMPLSCARRIMRWFTTPGPGFRWKVMPGTGCWCHCCGHWG